MKVVDASVVCKWFVDEEGTDRALVLRDRAARGEEELVAPDLLLVEVANALRWKRGYDEGSVARAVRDVMALGVDLVTPTAGLVSSAVRVAYTHSLTVYDAMYVALAKDVDAELVTADGKILSAFRDMSFVVPLQTIR